MPATEAQIRAKNKYNRKAYDSVHFRIRRDNDLITLETLRKAVEESGESMNTYILEALRRRIESGK